MLEQNIMALKNQFCSLGFDDGLEHALRCHICFQPLFFILRQRVVRDKDVLIFHFYLERQDEGGTYRCIHYDVILRKEIEIPDVFIGETNTIDLDQKMGAIDWSIDFEGEPIALPSDLEGKREEAICEVVTALDALSLTEEGRVVAGRLKVKYWADLPPEQFIENLSSLKAQFEIRERFYVFSPGQSISVDEAYRFLSNKWLEKQLRKKAVNTSESRQKALIRTGAVNKSKGKPKTNHAGT